MPLRARAAQMSMEPALVHFSSFLGWRKNEMVPPVSRTASWSWHSGDGGPNERERAQLPTGTCESDMGWGTTMRRKGVTRTLPASVTATMLWLLDVSLRNSWMSRVTWIRVTFPARVAMKSVKGSSSSQSTEEARLSRSGVWSKRNSCLRYQW